MDVVLGLSMTSSSVRWVLVEGGQGEGRTLDRGSLPIDPHEGLDVGALLSALLDRSARRVHAIGLNWASAAEATASAVWQALTDRGVENVIAVSAVEAAEALACGVAELAGCDRVVVCVAEPESAVRAAVTPDGVTADRVAPAELAEVDGFAPETVLVAGSGDIGSLVETLRQRTDAAVVAADEADLALARGAALAAESAVSMLDAQAAPAHRTVSPTAALGSVLVAAVVTFVVSLSVAVGMSLTPDAPDTQAPRLARSITEPIRETAPEPSAAEAAAPESPGPQPAPPPGVPVPAEPVAVNIPVPDAMEIVEPPAGPVPAAEVPLFEPAPPPANVPEAPALVPNPPAFVPAPPPAYVPEAPAPGYVPPPPNAGSPQLTTPQQPRLRDRIIERIPIINRFHEPEYDYTP